MRKRIAKSLMAAALVTSIFGTTVFADDVTDLTNKKNQAESELSNFESEMSYLLIQVDELETKMNDKNDQINNATVELASAQQVMNQQYENMKLRIKYMYEDQSASIAEAFITAQNMSDAMNKAEYIQQVYDYDRSKLEELYASAMKIKQLKEQLDNDKQELESYGAELQSKQNVLYTAIADQKDKISDISAQLTAAQQAAAEEQRRREAAAAAASSGTTASAGTTASSGGSVTYSVNSNNNSSTASSVVGSAYSYLGVPYVWGGTSPSGFDCSGLVNYCYGQAGVSVPRTSGALASSGQSVGSLSNAEPGDVICYPGHVGIYIGGGQIIHAPTTGDVVKVSSADILPITAIRRYW